MQKLTQHTTANSASKQNLKPNREAQEARTLPPFRPQAPKAQPMNTQVARAQETKSPSGGLPPRLTDAQTRSALAQSMLAGTVRKKSPVPTVLAPSASRTKFTAPPEETTPEETETPSTRQRQRLRRETRAQMLERLTNPVISLHEASVLLRVCPATVRRYTNSGLLTHVRTEGKQRRFYLRDVLALMRQLESRRR